MAQAAFHAIGPECNLAKACDSMLRYGYENSGVKLPN